jgi:uncharacterized membrane protein
MKSPAFSLDAFKLMPVRWLRTVTDQWRLLASALVAGAIIHILVTLSAAQFKEAAAYKTLSRGLPVNQVMFAPAISAKSQPLPFFTADALYSYCRYDASSARIRVDATLPDAGWSLALYTTRGENFYFVPGNDDRQTDVKLVLEPPGNVFAHGSPEVATGNQIIPLVKLPHVRGLIILRAPIKGQAYRRQMDELRSAFHCRTQRGITALRR